MPHEVQGKAVPDADWYIVRVQSVFPEVLSQDGYFPAGRPIWVRLQLREVRCRLQDSRQLFPAGAVLQFFLQIYNSLN